MLNATLNSILLNKKAAVQIVTAAFVILKLRG
jgi:hypothetical protein